MSTKEIENNFTYHAPKPGQAVRYDALRAKMKECAITVARLCPTSREQALAITHLEQAMFWANAAVARNEEQPAMGPRVTRD